MSFIPGEQSEIAVVASNNGSGVDITSVNDIDYLSLALVAGTNIALTPSLVDKTITISSAGGGGGIAAVQSTAGSGINVTNLLPATVELSSALQAGTGINLTPGINKNLIISNTNTFSAANGSGININQVGANRALSANIVGGPGINLAPSSTNTSVTISNTGVQQVQAGQGILVSSPTGIATITNNGVVTNSAGTGIAVSTVGGNSTISNTGVTQIVAGSGIAVSGSGTGVVTITNTDPSPATIVGGTGISVNTSGGTSTISNTGVVGISSPVPGIQIGGTAQNPTVTNTGCIQVNAGTGINITGNQPSLPVINNTGVLSLTAGTGLQVSQSTGNVTISSTLGNPANYTKTMYQVQSGFPNDSTTVVAYGFSVPPWWNPSNCFARCSITFYEPAAQAWTSALGGLVADIRYYPSGPFAPSFLFTGMNMVKPAGATTLKVTWDNIQFQGVPQAGQANQLELTNFSANPSISAFVTVTWEFYQVSSPATIQYGPNWSGVSSPGSFSLTDYSVGYYQSS